MEYSQQERYLAHIHSPEDVKVLPKNVMPALAKEIREELVKIVPQTGGHLASNLGVVELTMAIHRVFSVPYDHVIFDVGHQSYVHKMLTGRYAQMHTLRQAGGLSGFTKRSESEYDCFGAGHSSTSLSAALGFAMSDRLAGSDAYTVAIVGDGAYTGGMIHEALNNCRKDLNLIIIMNENEMSISKNIGRFATGLSKIRTRSGYFRTKKATGKFLRRIPLIGKGVYRFVLGTKKALKNALYGSNYFESMGLTYLGPIDGNDLDAVENLLQEAKKMHESVVVHLKTKKGKGFDPAESAPDLYHGVAPCDAKKPTTQTFSGAMGEFLAKKAEKDDRICAITAAMCDGTGLNAFRANFPDRFFDVGIAEEHAVTFAAGLCANGMKPVVAVYSTFLQRAYDSIIHDVALQELGVVLCVDRAGLNSGDGATHHGIFDVSFLSHIPNITIYTPITIGGVQASMEEALHSSKPCAIRYPNGTESKEILKTFYADGVYEKPSFRCDFSVEDCPQILMITHGRIVTEALKAKRVIEEKGISVGIVLLEMLKPYDSIADRLVPLISHHPKLLFVEEEIRCGGMGSNLSDCLMRKGVLRAEEFCIVATDDSFVDHRTENQTIYEAAGVSAKDMVKAALSLADR